MSTDVSASTNSISKMVKHVIDIDEVLEDLYPSEMSVTYTVPSNLMKMDEEAFTPQLISIGPIHFGKEHLKEMQKIKYIYFKAFWKRRVINEEVMNEYKNSLERSIDKIKDCYAHKFPDIIADEEFVEIVLLDSVFIVQHFLSESDHDNGEYILTNYVRKGIQRDLILLENQLPLWVLVDLYKKISPGEDFLKLTHGYFAYLNLNGKYPENEHKKDDASQHFVDFFIKCYVPERVRHYPERIMFTEHEILQASSSQLYEAGISFECANDKTTMTNIKYQKTMPLCCLPTFCFFHSFQASLKFPRLKVDNSTVTVLKNLMAFEQNHRLAKPFITSYVSFVCSLVRTKEDVQLLVENGCILREHENDEELLNLVKGLSKHVVPAKSPYPPIIRKLNQHYNSDCKRTMGRVTRVYFRDVWRGSSTIFGIVVLIFTIFGFYRDIRAFVLSN